MTTTLEVIQILNQAGQAHHHYEQTVLKGIYDQDWPTWYARYALDHGLIGLLASSLTLATLSEFFRTSYEIYTTIPQPPSWSDYTAQQLITHFGT